MENYNDRDYSKDRFDIEDRETENADGPSFLRSASRSDAAERRSPVLQLSEVEEILEHSDIVPEIESSAGRIGSSGASERDATESLESSVATATEDDDSSDTMTESHEDALSTAAISVRGERRRSSLMDGLWACLSPVASLWKGREKRNHGDEEDAFEIPFADIKELELIGSGSQGIVFRGEYRGERVAVKKVKDKSYCNEISQLRKLSHPNVIQLRCE